MVEKERQEEEAKAKLAAQQKPTTTVGPNATVLKPRSAAQPKSGGLVLKTPSDKPTLVAKPSAPTPTRSPWASLPPVDKVPPVDINPPNPQPTSRTQYNDPYGSNSMPPPAAMEIAADDFTRTRRDNQNAGQLYNAQNGQYEPANTGRRGSVRKDQNFRPPALLQRGSARDQHEPAEPSAAFQTHRSGSQQDAAPWARRGSSTVSGESGQQGRRMSTSKGSDMTRMPMEMLQQRRDSQHSQALRSPSTPGHAQPTFPHRGASPAQQSSHSATQSPGMQHSQLSQEARSTAVSPYQSRPDQAAATIRDDVAHQAQMMKAKREMAIKRKKEEEEREEAAKRERIRLKMEQLGLEPLEEKREPAKEEPEKQIEKRQIDPVIVEKRDPEKQEVFSNSQVLAPAQEVSASTSRSPPKPPAPDAFGMPQQYGMMRLHPATSNNVPQPPSERSTMEKTRLQAPSQRISPPGLEPKTEQPEPLPSPRVNGVTPSKHPDAPIYRAPDASNQNIARETRQQPWNNASRDPNAYTGWSGQGMAREPSASSSVWGPPSHARNLGNGTFDRSVQRPQSRPQEQFASPALEPIGPPRHLQRPRESSEIRSHEMGPSPVVEDFQTIPTFPPSEAPTPANRPEHPGPPPSSDTHVTPPQFGTGTQFKSQINNVERPVRSSEPQKSTLAAWGNFQTTDAERNRQATQQYAARQAEEARLGVRRPEPQLPTMNETWRQAKVDEHGQRQIVGVVKGQNTHDRFVGPQINGDVQSPSFTAPVNLPSYSAGGIGRGSRFFPAGTAIHPQYQNGGRYPPGYRSSSSPPPPEDWAHFHPAYIRDSLRPQVNLPFVKDKPKVKLPPAVNTPVQSPQLTEVRAIPIRAASQPLVNNPSWQDRFNGLLGVKKPSPEKKFAQVAEFSATKVPLDSPPVQISAAVSLPPKSGEAISRSLEVASKAMEDEEALFENREFGSLPAVQIPTQAPEVGWSAVQAPKRGQYRNSKLSKEVDSASKETFIEKDISSSTGGILIFIRMLGMQVPKSVSISRPASQGPGHAQSASRSYQGRNASKGFKPRDSSGNFNSEQKNPQRGPQRNVTQSGPPGPARGQPGKNHPAWGQRATNAVH